MDRDFYYFLTFACFAFGIGCCIASFLNVCIWRLPREESVVWPPSHCPKCNARIRWYQNIPVLSWLALRGRCANCHEPISARYTVVELLGGVLFLLAYLQWASGFFLHAPTVLGLQPLLGVWAVPVYWLVFSGLILGSFIDLEHFYLPDRVTIGGMILGVPLSFLVPELQGETNGLTALYWSLGGMSAGFFGLWALSWLASKAFKKEAMGFGDVKLLAGYGALMGVTGAVETLIVAAILGIVVMVPYGKIAARRNAAGQDAARRDVAETSGQIPFGPFLAVAAPLMYLWGEQLFNLYVALVFGE